MWFVAKETRFRTRYTDDIVRSVRDQATLGAGREGPLSSWPRVSFLLPWPLSVPYAIISMIRPLL